jgi:hypothetical protein
LTRIIRTITPRRGLLKSAIRSAWLRGLITCVLAASSVGEFCQHRLE